MKEITLKFGGSIYMENYGEQEEEDRIKLFDSDKEYLDHFTVEPLEKTRSIYKGLRIEDLLDVYADQLAEKESVEALLNYLGVNWMGIFPNEHALYRATGLNSKNEWVNHIGEYFVEIEEH